MTCSLFVDRRDEDREDVLRPRSGSQATGLNAGAGALVDVPFNGDGM